MKPLLGKSVIITGSGRGIGAACAALVARLGAAVVINDIDADAAREISAQLNAVGGQTAFYACDITDWDQAGKLVAFCQERFGSLDGLVNNAGLFAMGRLAEMQRGDADRLIAVNITGSINCAAHAVKIMLAQASGSIVNVTSGAQMGIPAMGVYGATKGAIASLTYAWAAELAGSGVRVNALSPLARTRMGDTTARYLEARGAAMISTDIPAEMNAPVVAYLLADDAALVNGQILRVEGGQISLVVHPGVLIPPLQAQSWSFEQVRDAFAKDLIHRQLPLGIAGIEVAGFGPVSALWKNPRPAAA